MLVNRFILSVPCAHHCCGPLFKSISFLLPLASIIPNLTLKEITVSPLSPNVCIAYFPAFILNRFVSLDTNTGTTLVTNITQTNSSTSTRPTATPTQNGRLTASASQLGRFGSSTTAKVVATIFFAYFCVVPFGAN